MNIDALTFGELKQIAAMFQATSDCACRTVISRRSIRHCPLLCGWRIATRHQQGKLVELAILGRLQ